MDARAIQIFDKTPRVVPLRLLSLLYFYKRGVWWLFLGVGMPFAILCVPNTDIGSLWQFRGPLATAAGRVVRWDRSTFEASGERKNDPSTPIYVVYYTFSLPDHSTHADLSYVVGRSYRAGEAVTVEFSQGSPEVSRIAGARRKPLGLEGLGGCIFLLMPLPVVLYQLWGAARAHRLLRVGRLAPAVFKTSAYASSFGFKSYERRSLLGSRVRVMELTFEFIDAGGQARRAVLQTSQPEQFTSEPETMLLYDTEHPERTVFLGALPGRPVVSDEGRLTASIRLSAWWPLAAPVLVILGNAVVAWVVLSGPLVHAHAFRSATQPAGSTTAPASDSGPAARDAGAKLPGATPGAADVPSASGPAVAPESLAGRWRLTLRGGHTLAVTLSAAGGDRVVFKMAGNFGGTYELRGDRLVVVEPANRGMAGLVWQVRSADELVLIAAPAAGSVGQDYTGARMGRE